MHLLVQTTTTLSRLLPSFLALFSFYLSFTLRFCIFSVSSFVCFYFYVSSFVCFYFYVSSFYTLLSLFLCLSSPLLVYFLSIFYPSVRLSVCLYFFSHVEIDSLHIERSRNSLFLISQTNRHCKKHQLLPKQHLL